MAVAFANLGVSATPDIASTANTASYANTSWTPPTSGLICCFAVSTATVLPGAAPTLSGNGITWILIATQGSGTGDRITLFGANAAGSSAGVTTFTPVETSTGCALSFFQVTGADEANGVAQTFVQAPTATGTGLSGSVALAAAADSNNRPISGWTHAATEVASPRVNWTEADDLSYATPAQALETQFRSDAHETTASASWATSIRWDGIAAEIKVSTLGRGSGPRVVSQAIQRPAVW